MSNSTDLIYNGVNIYNCMTRRFHQEAVYEESGTDLIYQKFVIAVVGYIYLPTTFTNPNVIPATPAGPTGITTNTPASTALNATALRRTLMDPRHTFVMNVNNIPLLTAIPFDPSIGPPATNTMDLNNGPKPRRCDITQIAGNFSMRVEFEIEINTAECYSMTNGDPWVLNNRWSMRDEIDENWYTTRTMSGKLIIGGIGPGVDPDKTLNINSQYRGLIVPPLQDGFKRERMSFQSSTDGLSLAYEIVDREVYASCPIPGTTWEGTYEISTADGVKSYHSVNLHFEGPKNADRAALIAAIVAVADHKLMLSPSNGQPDPQNIPCQVAFIEHMHLNAFDFRATYLLPMGSSNSLPFGMNANMFGVPLDIDIKVVIAGNSVTYPKLPDYDSQKSPVPPLYGTTSAAGLFLCQLQSPCQPEGHTLPEETDTYDPADDNPDAGEEIYTAGPGETHFFEPPGTNVNPPAYSPQVFFNVQDEPIDPTEALDYNEPASIVYNNYRIDAHYDEPQMVAMLPIAKPAGIGSVATPTAVFVQLAPPITRRTVTVKAEAYKSWPLMPDLSIYPLELPNGGFIVLLDKQFLPKAPPFASDGKTPIYSIDAEYLFGYTIPPDPMNDPLLTGSLPYLTTNLVETAVPSSIYQTGIIE